MPVTAKKKPVGIERLLGIALGCLRLSYDDFCRLTPGEFQAAYDAWNDEETAEWHAEWERTRMLAAIVIQPHVKSKITPQRLLPFPWEKPERKHAGPQPTKEEDLERFKRLAGAMGSG